MTEFAYTCAYKMQWLTDAMEKNENLFRRFFIKFFKDGTTTLASSLAFYTVLSLAPLLILFVTVASQLSGDLQENFQTQVRNLVGTDAALAVEMVIENAKSRPDLTSLASLLGVFTLLLSASLIFGELRSALNRIYDVRPHDHPHPGFLGEVWSFAKARIFHVGLAVSFIFVLIVSLIVSSAISASIGSKTTVFAISLDALISIIFYVGIFTAMFRYLPDHHLPFWRAAQGGLFTAVLFVAGKQVVGLYIGNSAIGSSYGAAGSFVVLLVWVYYSSIITFIGAQLSSILHAPKRADI